MCSNYTTRIDGLALVSLAILALMAFSLISGQELSRVEASSVLELAASPGEEPASIPELISSPEPEPEDILLPPYEAYILTQGPHGQSYGHLAVDLTAGKGAVILSPITGTVSAFYVDELGNTTLIIENSHYQVTLLHGDYVVQIGDALQTGQPIGYESNHGFTVDAWGVPCWGRNCGFHTHLNVYDKLSGSNVNPLELWSP